jgi:predicted acylesterase/phospholipase RssA
MRGVLMVWLAGLLVVGAGAQEMPARDRDQVLLIVTFSGGGTRAAAFGYGAVQALADTPVGAETLLDRIDRVSGVSGGSFVATQVALDRRPEALASFRPRVLQQNLELELLKALTRRSFRVMGRALSRTDVAADLYTACFDGATLGDATGPELWIQATDLYEGRPFVFRPAALTPLGLTPADIPVGRAIAAAAAMPGVFPPLVLRAPTGDDGADDAGDGRPPAGTVTLADGGVVDNLGLEVLLQGTVLAETRRIIVVVVNSRRDRVVPEAAGRSGLLTAGYTVMIQQRRIDRLVLALAEERLHRLAAEARAAGRNLATTLVEISFEQSGHAAELDDIGTRLHLDEAEVELLIAAGETVTRAQLPRILPLLPE